MIYEKLPTGRRNAISTPDLMRITGIRTERELRKKIRKERDAGCLILSSKAAGGGYYVPESSTELRDFLAIFESEARSLFAMLFNTRAELRRLEAIESGQFRIDGIDEERQV